MSGRLDDRELGPAPPVFRLAPACLVLTFPAWAFAGERLAGG
jgi:hypothetical protein